MPKLVKTLSVFGVCLGAAAFAATTPDFSGTYAAQQKRGNRTNAPSVVLRVVQSESAIEVTRAYGDKSATNRFPLDGSEGDYTTETGVRGNCKSAPEKRDSRTGNVRRLTSNCEWAIYSHTHDGAVAIVG